MQLQVATKSTITWRHLFQNVLFTITINYVIRKKQHIDKEKNYFFDKTILTQIIKLFLRPKTPSKVADSF